MPDFNQPPQQPLDHEGPRNRRTPTVGLVYWLAGAVGIVILTIVWLAPIQNHGYGAPRIKSQANLRSIGQSILLYCNDNQGRYPETFQQLFLDEDISTGIFVSPQTDDTPADGPTTQAVADNMVVGGHLSYVYVGRGLTDKTATPDTIVAYEPPPHPGDGGNVLFGDGHVEYIDAAHIAAIIARHNSGGFPVTMPSP